MNRITLLTFMFLIQFGFSQNEINRFDENGKRHGIWTKTYDKGSIRYKGEFEHGKEIGIFKFYTEENPNTPEVTKEFFKNTNKVNVTYFYPDGKIKSVGQMIDKERVGLWIYYFKDGKTKLSEETYKNGLLEGDYKIYYSNGNLTEWSVYQNGLLHGTSKRYSDTGILVEAIDYANGKLNGKALYYNTNGDLILKGNYLNDVSVGAWESYENGKLKETTYPNKKQ